MLILSHAELWGTKAIAELTSAHYHLKGFMDGKLSDYLIRKLD